MIGEQKAKVQPTVALREPEYADGSVSLQLVDSAAQSIRVDQFDDEITELAAHMQSHGLLQPIGVRPLESGRFELLWGARRLAAARRLRWSEIPARIAWSSDSPVKAIAAAENLLRRQLTLEEECDVVSALHTTEGKSPDQISSLVGKSRSWVLRRLAIPGLPRELRGALLDQQISIAVAEEIARLEDEGLRTYVLTQAISSKSSHAAVRGMVEAIRSTPSLADAIAAGTAEAEHPALTQTLLMACGACGVPQPIASLTVVRVCSDGCVASEAAAAAARPVNGGEKSGT